MNRTLLYFIIGILLIIIGHVIGLSVLYYVGSFISGWFLADILRNKN